MTPAVFLKRQPAVRSFLSLFSEAGTAMKAAVNEAVFAAFQAGRQWGHKPMHGETAFCMFLDGDIRPSTVRARADDCRNDYVAATQRSWRELHEAGFRVRKVRLVPVSR